MPDQFAQLRDHFVAALEHDGLEAQLRYAEKHCTAESELRVQLVDMLKAHHGAGDFLASRLDATEELRAITEEPGTQIGPYKLLQVIGEGGMGVVYMAEQSAPVERRVALKVIKPLTGDVVGTPLSDVPQLEPSP